MQFYDVTILIFGLSEREGLILDQCALLEIHMIKVLIVRAFSKFLKTLKCTSEADFLTYLEARGLLKDKSLSSYLMVI